MKHAGNKKFLITTLIILSIAIAYVHQMSPSPLLLTLRDAFHLGNNDALLNLAVSIVFPLTILASIVGGVVEQKIGTRRLFICTLVFLMLGILVNYVATSYLVFLLGRVVFSVGFGLSIPFIGSAIMKWYEGRQREIMSTINGLFPYVGTVICFSMMVPLANGFGGSWKQAMGVWGLALGLITLVWVLSIRKEDVPLESSDAQDQTHVEQGLYRNLWRRRDLRILSYIFMMDFFCYSYIAVILPSFLSEIGNMPEATAGVWAAVAFPAVGILGGALGGVLTTRSGKRKPTLIAAQVLKWIGIIIAALGSGISVWVTIVGISIFGLGNSLWMPILYAIPIDLEDMTPTRVGAAFALVSSCGFFVGFIAPILGGWMTTALMGLSSATEPVARHAFGLKWSLFASGFVNLASLIGAILISETGPGRRSRV